MSFGCLVPISDCAMFAHVCHASHFKLHLANCAQCRLSHDCCLLPLFMLFSGNYGNQLDPNVPPSSSTTQPTNPVSDGEHYHYLPWSSTKPCVIVDCQWEDIHYRLDALNILNSMCDRLVRIMQFFIAFCYVLVSCRFVFHLSSFIALLLHSAPVLAFPWVSHCLPLSNFSGAPHQTCATHGQCFGTCC